MKTIDQGSLHAATSKSPLANNTLPTRVRHDHLTASAISIVVNNASHENEKVSVEIPSVPIRKIIKKLEKLAAEEEFKQNNKGQFDQLTKREIQVLSLLALGYNNPEISQKLFISRRTVEQHHKNVNRKLSIKSYADLMKYSLAFDLI